MQLYLLRLGQAGSRDAAGYPDDEERPLTPQGRAKTEAAARGMEAAGLRIDILLTSPLARARQTADIVAAVLTGCPRPKTREELAPGGDAAAMLAGSLARRRPDLHAMLVGHEPDLSRLAGLLLLAGGSRLDLELRKGGLIRIDFDGPPLPAAGRLVLMMPPRLLRRL